jgi:transcriptional regulator with XRE-family HTH domain
VPLPFPPVEILLFAFSHATPYTAGRTTPFDTWCETVTQRRLADYIGITVRRLRSDREFTLQALADESGVSKSYLGDIEKGRKNPTTDVIEAIAEALGVPARELLYHAALDEDDPFFEPEQLSLEDVAEEDVETRELTRLARRIRPTDRRFLLDLARRLSR